MQTCQAAWDFSYGGHLAGSSLKAKRTVPILREGRAWGAGVAALHSTQLDLFGGGDPAGAIVESLDADAARQREFGVHDPAEHSEMEDRLMLLLAHYRATAAPLRVSRLEEQIIVPIPSRTGKRRSNLYAFLAYFDGVALDGDGRTWLVEYKLRSKLSDYALVANGRQIRWYAWAFQEKYGVPVTGVLVDERLNEVPKPARLVRGKRKVDGEYPLVPSHKKDQMTTPDLYLALCQEHGVDPVTETLEHLNARHWQKRHPVQFRAGEIEEAGQELVSAAKQIRDLDSGELLPLRSVRPANCNGCFFREICPSPDEELVDALFERTVPKRDRPAVEEAVAA